MRSWWLPQVSRVSAGQALGLLQALSLLCVALAWQQRENIRIEEGGAAARVAAAAGDGQSNGIESSPAKPWQWSGCLRGDQVLNMRLGKAFEVAVTPVVQQRYCRRHQQQHSLAAALE
ncbi:hypothetical protein N2152v2_000392 [Parachlorella kessleri]